LLNYILQKKLARLFTVSNAFQLVFGVAEEMLKRTTEDTKWAMIRAKSGWMIMGALLTLGKKFSRYSTPLLNKRRETLHSR
jgi:hypothetical protein